MRRGCGCLGAVHYARLSDGLFVTFNLSLEVKALCTSGLLKVRLGACATYLYRMQLAGGS